MKKLLMLCLMLLPASLWAEEWKLVNGKSDINFVSVKKNKVAEVHHFTGLSGSVNGGSASIDIHLASIKSGIGIRDERMASMLFEVSKFATATIQADIPASIVGDLEVGKAISIALPITLDLHGLKKAMKADVTIVVLADHALQVTSRSPVIIKAADFGLDVGIEALRDIAGLPSIASSVPVTFELYFAQ